MPKTEKIRIKKKKKRIPLPQKPPKAEKNKKAYNRRKDKEKLRKEVNKEGKQPDSVKKDNITS